jgi:glycosyltransferase involved in cell wall biosynthesis
MRVLLSASHRYPAFQAEGTGFLPTKYPSGSGFHMHDLLARGLAESGHEVFYLLRGGWCRQLPRGVVPVVEPVLDVDLYHSVLIPGINEDVLRMVSDAGRAWVATCHLDRSSTGPPSLPNWIFVSRHHAHVHGSDRYVWNAIDPEEYVFSESKQEYLLFMSSMEHALEKGLHTALQLSRRQGFPLVVAGSARTAETIDEVRRLCQSYSAEYVGDVRGKRKAGLIAGAKALLFPSRMNEGCPVAILEALASGTPVISSAVGGCAEILTPRTGFLCDNMQEFSAAIDQLHRISPHDCRRDAVERFHYRRMTADYVREYELEIQANTREIR